MKKISVVFVLSFICFVSLGFSAKSVNAANCASGDFFNSVTGQACATTTIPNECTSGDLFSVLTGKPCATVGAGTPQSIPSNTITPPTQFQIGSKGDAVRTFQQTLKDAGFLSGRVDGVFGKITSAAATAYRKLYPFPVPCPLANSVGDAPPAPCPPILVNPPSSGSPVISGVSGPQSLDVNAQGAWSVTASSPDGGNLSYGVIWGDENSRPYSMNQMMNPNPVQQSATFSHSYSQSGNYTPIFIVKDDIGQIAQTSLSVNVSGGITVVQVPHISSISPTSGPVGTTVTISGSGLAVPNVCTNTISGGTCTNNKTIINFGGASIKNATLFNDTSITFQVPSAYGCEGVTAPYACDQMVITPGTYSVFVTNSNGTSNIVNFIVTTPSYAGYCEHAAPPYGYHYEGTDVYPTCAAHLVKNI